MTEIIDGQQLVRKYEASALGTRRFCAFPIDRFASYDTWVIRENPVSEIRMRRIAIFMDSGNRYRRSIFQGLLRYIVTKRWGYHSVVPGAQFLPALRGWQPDGVIGRINDPALHEEVQNMGVPVVHLEWGRDGKAPSVTSVLLDNAAVGRLAAKHLTGLRYQHFGFFGPRSTPVRRLREHAFRVALEAAGKTVDSYMLSPGDEALSGNWAQFEQGVTQWLSSLPKPVAVLAGHDRAAQELALICQRMGLRIPEDVALLGVENDELCCHGVSPPLSTIALPGERLGFEGAALLDHLLDGGSPPMQATMLPPLHVVSRQSTDIMCADAPKLVQAVRYIREHAHEPIGVEQVLEHVSLGRRQLERLFQSVLGRTPHQEIRRVRIEQAKHLLADTDISMYAVAERCGFHNANRLRTNFRADTGMTPAVYRQQAQLRHTVWLAPRTCR